LTRLERKWDITLHPEAFHQNYNMSSVLYFGEAHISDIYSFYERAYNITNQIVSQKPSPSSVKCIQFKNTPVETLLIPVMEERSPRTVVVVPKKKSSFTFEILSLNDNKTRKLKENDLIKINREVSQDYTSPGWVQLGRVLSDSEAKKKKTALAQQLIWGNKQPPPKTTNNNKNNFVYTKPPPKTTNNNNNNFIYTKNNNQGVKTFQSATDLFVDKMYERAQKEKTNINISRVPSPFVPLPPPIPPSYNQNGYSRSEIVPPPPPEGPMSRSSLRKKAILEEIQDNADPKAKVDSSFFKGQNFANPLQRELAAHRKFKPALQKALNNEGNGWLSRFTNMPSMTWYGLKGKKEAKIKKGKKDMNEMKEVKGAKPIKTSKPKPKPITIATRSLKKMKK
jgi:hypothetical protein